MYQHKHRKKGKYIEAFLERQRYFTLIMLSVDGMMGGETKEATKQLYSALLTELYRNYSATHRYLQAHLSLNMVHAFSFLVQGAQSGKPRQEKSIPEDGVEEKIMEAWGV